MRGGRYARLEARAAEVAARGLRRRLRALIPEGPARARDADGRRLTIFSSNDYLGLAHHPAVRDAWRGGGGGSSRLLAGDRPAHRDLEAALAARFGRPALVFSSGYQANLAVMSTLFEAGDVVASDALNHASIIDGLRLSRAERRVVPHADPAALPHGAAGAGVEGLYSMDGDRPPLADYPSGPWLVVDEAHAVGCVGPGGRGAAADAGVVPDVLIGTFGKAYGAAGAFVVGPPSLIELLISTGRSFVYTTALAPAAARAALEGLRRAADALRARLAENTPPFRAGLAALGLPSMGRDHVVPVVLGAETMSAAARLYEAGIFAPGIRAPTVAPGAERLRFSLSAAHTDDQIDRALEALSRCLLAR